MRVLLLPGDNPLPPLPHLLPVQEVRREKVLVERLMRQCQQERRIATQLMHIRKEKDTIRNNRCILYTEATPTHGTVQDISHSFIGDSGFHCTSIVS